QRKQKAAVRACGFGIWDTQPSRIHKPELRTAGCIACRCTQKWASVLLQLYCRESSGVSVQKNCSVDAGYECRGRLPTSGLLPPARTGRGSSPNPGQPVFSAISQTSWPRGAAV